MRPLKGLIGSWPKSAKLGGFKQIQERNAVNLGAGGGGLPGCTVRCAGCKVRCAGCRVRCAGCRVQGAGCRVQSGLCSMQCLVFSVFSKSLSKMYFFKSYAQKTVQTLH